SALDTRDASDGPAPVAPVTYKRSASDPRWAAHTSPFIPCDNNLAVAGHYATTGTRVLSTPGSAERVNLTFPLPRWPFLPNLLGKLCILCDLITVTANKLADATK